MQLEILFLPYFKFVKDLNLRPTSVAVHGNAEDTRIVRCLKERFHVMHLVDVRVVVREFRADLDLLAGRQHPRRCELELEHLSELRGYRKHLERLSRGRAVDDRKVERVRLERLEVIEI